MKVVHTILLLSLAVTSAHAYLDPGSGSLLIYGLLGVCVTLLYSFRRVYYRIFRWVAGRHHVSDMDIGAARIVFHSEGKNYWDVFAPILRELDARKIFYVYVTHDEHEPVHAHQSEYLTVKLCKSEMQEILFMNKLKAALVVSTTPQLDVYMFVRSKHVSHYAHIVHAPTDVLVYKKFAFDFYDSVLCSGPHQIEHLRQLESCRHTKQKLLLKTGLTYYDTHIENQGGLGPRTRDNPPTILYAPTWGPASAITQYGYEIFEHLLKLRCSIIFRPHPQLFKSQKEIIDPILKRLQDIDSVTIDTNHHARSAMHKADILVSDISGIIFDFGFVYNKPIVMIETQINAQGYEADGLIPYEDIWEYKMRSKMGRVVSKQDVPQLRSIIEQVLHDNAAHRDQVAQIKDEYVYNFGCAGKVAANQLIDILNTLE